MLYFTVNKREIERSQKLLQYFNGATTYVPNLVVLAGALPIIFVFYLQDLLIASLLSIP